MRSTVSRWGNSLALRLPRNIAEDLNLVEGSEVDLKADGGQLVATPAKPRYRLADMLATVSAQEKEVDWGEPRGKEEW